MQKIARCAVAASVLAAASVCMPATAATLVVNVAGVQSVGKFGNGNNVVNIYNIGSGSLITDISYTVTLTSYGASRLSDISLSFGMSDNSRRVSLTPGFANAFTGTATYTETANLVDIGFDFAVGADGLLRLEYFGNLNNFPVSPDGIWNSGTITFTYSPTISAAVPEPATWAMMLAGFGLIGSGMRRRNAVKARVTYA